MELPVEIQDMIIRYLDTTSYVERHLEDDPEKFFDKDFRPCGPDACKDLKAASLVCRNWRIIARPLLFRHLNLRLMVPPNFRNQDWAGPYWKTMGFLTSNMSFLAESMQSTTLVLLAPACLKDRRNDFLKFAEGMEIGIHDAIKAFDSIRERTDGYLEEEFFFGHLFQLLLSLSPQRLTVLASGSTMEVSLQNRTRYSLRHCMMQERARLQIFSVSRRQAGNRRTIPKVSADRVEQRLNTILRIVGSEDVIINEGSCLKQECESEEDYSEVSLEDVNLHTVFMESVLDGSLRGVALKSLSFISEFNFGCGLRPITQFASASSYRDPAQMIDGMPRTDIYHHRILPRNFSFPAFLGTRGMGTFDRRRFRSLYYNYFRGENYLMAPAQRLSWASVYKFHDITSDETFPMWHHVARRLCEADTTISEFQADRAGWLVRSPLGLMSDWAESEDLDKREVARTIDSRWGNGRHESLSSGD